MDPTTMSMPMAMAPSSDAAAAAAAAGHQPDSGAAMGSSAAMMAMTFFQGRGTPLFAAGWAPRSGAAYAATCLFLVGLGVVLRCLLALRPLLEAIVWRAPPAHDPEATGAHDDDDDEDEDVDGDYDEQQKQQHLADCEILVPASGNPGGSPHRRPDARARHRLHRAAAGPHPPSAARELWAEVRRRGRASRLGASAGRAAFELLLAVVGYLLMLAVMTMNLGYFASVLAGVFLGTFVLGDLATSSSLYQDHHC